MADYINPPLETDPAALAALAYERLADLVPGWQAADGNFETLFIDALAQIAGEVRDVASDVPVAIYKHFGTVLLGVAQEPAASAAATSTWTAIDTAGHTITAGTNVAVRDANDELVAFTVIADVTIPAGSSTTTVGQVPLLAVVPGITGNGLTGVSELLDALDFVATITLTGPTSGGADAESDDDYLDRLTDELTLLTPRPILPRDFAVLYRRIPTVARSLCVDGYDPVAGTFNNERMVTVYGIDEAGLAVSSGTKAAGKTYLESLREETFVVNTDDPTYTPICVTVEVMAVPGFDTATLVSWVTDALNAYLSPANWGKVGGTAIANPLDWSNVLTVRYLEVAEVINRVNGVDYIVTLTVASSRPVTGLASTDVFTAGGHGLVRDEPVVFSALTGGAGITAGTTYYVRDVTTNTFKVAATVGGVAVDFTSNMTVGTVKGTGTGNVNLVGPAALPLQSTMTVTADAP